LPGPDQHASGIGRRRPRSINRRLGAATDVHVAAGRVLSTPHAAWALEAVHGMHATSSVSVPCCVRCSPLAMERSEIVVPARVVVILLVALFYPLECAFGLFARLVRTEPV